MTTKIQDDLQAFFANQTSKPVIWANQNGRRPEGVFFVLSLVSDVDEGGENIGSPDDEGNVVIVQFKVLTLRIQCFGNGCLGALQSVLDAFRKITTRQWLNDKGLAFYRIVSEATEMAEIVSTTFERRATADISFRYSRGAFDNVGLIETVTFTDQFDYASQSNATANRATGITISRNRR